MTETRVWPSLCCCTNVKLSQQYLKVCSCLSTGAPVCCTFPGLYVCIVFFVCADVWKTICEHLVCVFVLRGFTGACNRDLVFTVFRMMRLPPHPLSISPDFVTPSVMRKTAKGSVSKPRRSQRTRPWAGRGRNTLAFYPECHSSWQCRPVLLVHSHSKPSEGFMSCYDGAPTCGFMSTYILWPFFFAFRCQRNFLAGKGTRHSAAFVGCFL